MNVKPLLDVILMWNNNGKPCKLSRSSLGARNGLLVTALWGAERLFVLMCWRSFVAACWGSQLLNLHVMRFRGALVHRLNKDVIQLLIDCDLCVLKLGKGVNHDSIMEVILNHWLKKTQVVSRELADALVQSAGYFRVRLALSVHYLLNVVFALAKVKGELAQVSDKQLSVREELLVFHKITDFLFVDWVLAIWRCWRALREDGESVVMFLSVE